ncbi:RND family efflux transporter, MFP subunit [Natronincola peptidivorans]|uniref:RND family efflux transporter, MFP subunit n=1 Tax=Natronincola peptidivorans TaxID=426128 RepID=A0A1I0C6W8_9FIRM|nr:efflux RND transporter periplasmic adaptor subunit [Natronincola peptidivorans]SET15110.1 RND family efflux transporter, MFP subunit [Natronincola peptidivorans]
MKQFFKALLMTLMMIFLIGCSTEDHQGLNEERMAAVRVAKTEESEMPTTIMYIGTVDSKEITSYSFITGGKLHKAYIKKGDKVEPGDKLAELEQTDFQYSLRMAEGEMLAAEAQYHKAEKGVSQEELERMRIDVKQSEGVFKYWERLYENMKVLYEAGGISKIDLDDTKLAYDDAKYGLKKAKEYLREMERGSGDEDKRTIKAQYQTAKANYDLYRKALEDTVLYANQEGIVVDLLFKENEIVEAGMPVAVIRSGKQVVHIGIPQQDLKRIHTGMDVMVDVDGQKAKGSITYIAEAPDLATRTYPAEIEVSEKQFRLGTIAKAEVAVGMEKGIWIPMTSVFSHGEDYVYIIKENRAFKRTIELLYNYNDKMLVKGIEAGELLAINGMQNLNDGSKVHIVE